MLNNNASSKRTSKKFQTPFGSFIGDNQYNIINNQKHENQNNQKNYNNSNTFGDLSRLSTAVESNKSKSNNLTTE